MDRTFNALLIRELGPGAGYRRPTQTLAARVTQGSPALEAMTDLNRASPATIRPQAPIEGANQFMIARGVRLLLVADDREVVLGVITATDILGEKPMLVSVQRGLKRAELTVGDIMTPAEHVEVLSLAEVERARVGHVVETLKRAGRQHALVVEMDGGRSMVRGIFSVSQIARQLGLTLQTSEVARTFAEIEAALAHQAGWAV